MNTKLDCVSPGALVAMYLFIGFLTLVLICCWQTNIEGGSVLLSYVQAKRVVQGELEQIQDLNRSGEIRKIGFNDERGNKRYFMYHHHQGESGKLPGGSGSGKLLGMPLYFYITNEGIILKDQMPNYVFWGGVTLFLSLVFSYLYFVIMSRVHTLRFDCEVRSKKSQYTLNLLKYVMFALSVAAVVSAAKSVHMDFFLPEDKAHVISVEGGCEQHYRIKAFAPSTRTEFEADWSSFNGASPATGQEVNICYPKNSEPVFAKHTSDKIGSVVLLFFVLAYLYFSSVILIRSRIQCRQSC